MEFEIKKVSTVEEAKIANEFLTKLIQAEKQYDKNINEKCIVTSLYENFYQNDDVCLLIAKVDNEIKGYLYGFIINGGDAYIKKTAQLEAMFVNEDFRGKKCGSKLIKNFKNWCKSQNITYIELKVCNMNNHARNLYTKEGFLPIKTTMIAELVD